MKTKTRRKAAKKAKVNKLLGEYELLKSRHWGADFPALLLAFEIITNELIDMCPGFVTVEEYRDSLIGQAQEILWQLELMQH